MSTTTRCRDAAAIILRHINLWTEEMTVAQFVEGTGQHHVRIAGALAELEKIGAVVSRVAPGGSCLLYRPTFIKLEQDPVQEMLTGKINLAALNAAAKTVEVRKL